MLAEGCKPSGPLRYVPRPEGSRPSANKTTLNSRFGLLKFRAAASMISDVEQQRL